MGKVWGVYLACPQMLPFKIIRWSVWFQDLDTDIALSAYVSFFTSVKKFSSEVPRGLSLSFFFFGQNYIKYPWSLKEKWRFQDWLSPIKIYPWSWEEDHFPLDFKRWKKKEKKGNKAFYQLGLTLFKSSQILLLKQHHTSPESFYINIQLGIKSQDFSTLLCISIC